MTPKQVITGFESWVKKRYSDWDFDGNILSKDFRYRVPIYRDKTVQMLWEAWRAGIKRFIK